MIIHAGLADRHDLRMRGQVAQGFDGIIGRLHDVIRMHPHDRVDAGVTLGQRRLDLDTARDSVRQNVVQSWGQLEAAKANIEATQAQVQASEIALNGVREEARVGQRTTLDVLNAQQDLVNARVSLVTAQRDRVVASYTVLAATGALSAQVLGLKIQVYDPIVHYQQVRDAWGGVRTPDGR